MSFILFIDESGHDLVNSPYEVIAGVVIDSRILWDFICEIHNLELKCFGDRYSKNEREIKAKKILKRKTFRLANQLPLIPEDERRVLAKKCLDNGANANKREITALAQAKLKFIEEVLSSCINFNCKIFAAISDLSRLGKLDSNDLLRKDYVYLFERYFYFLEEDGRERPGMIVFDELEKSESHLLIRQIENYFKKTYKGRERSGLVIPEPFFVHSDLSTGVQIADIIAYLISWGFRLNGMDKAARSELEPFINQMKHMRHRSVKEVEEIGEIEIWSVVFLK